MKKSSLAVLCSMLLSLCILTSCASYNAAQLPQLNLDTNAQKNQVEHSGFVSMAKPIYLETELKSYFDYDLIADNILPVQVYVLNKSYGKSCTFNITGINLTNSAGGTRLPMLSMEQLMDKIQKSYWRSAGWAIPLGVFSAIPAAINVAKTNEKIRVDYEARIIKNGTIMPGSSIEGVAFFLIPPDINDLSGWKLTTVIFDPIDSKSLNIEHNLAGVIEARIKSDQATEK